MVVGFTTTCTISAYYHYSSEYEPRSLCDKVYQRLATGRWFSPGTPISSTNKTENQNITEILLTYIDAIRVLLLLYAELCFIEYEKSLKVPKE
jgi:hypothetical protein